MIITDRVLVRRAVIPAYEWSPARRTGPRRFPTVVALIILAGVAGCGRKGQLRAPEDVVPATIADLAAKPVAEGVEVTWSRPTTYADGTRMLDLGGFYIERAGAGDGARAFERVATITVTDNARFRQLKRFRYVDPDQGTVATRSYRVVSFTVDGYVSGPSNVAPVQVITGGKESNAPLSAPQR